MSGQAVRTGVLVATGVLLILAGVFLNEDRDSVAIALIVIGAGEVTVGAVLPRLSELEIGPAKFSAKLLERDARFEPVLEQQSERVARLAALVSDLEQGTALARESLAKTYAELPRAEREGPALHVRRELAKSLPGGSAAASGAPQPLGEALAQLPPESRLAVALKFYDQLDDAAVAEILRRPVEEVRSLTAQGAERLASALAARAGELG